MLGEQEKNGGKAEQGSGGGTGLGGGCRGAVMGPQETDAPIKVSYARVDTKP